MKMLRIIHEWASELKVTLLERYSTSLVVNGRMRYFKIDYRIDRLAEGIVVGFLPEGQLEKK